MNVKHAYAEVQLTDDDPAPLDEPGAGEPRPDLEPDDALIYAALERAQDVEDPETDANGDRLPTDDEELAAPPPPPEPAPGTGDELPAPGRRRLRMSVEGLAALCREEGLRLQPYNDSAGHATVGVGHLIHRGPVTVADRARYRGFTREQAIALLKADVKPREDSVNDMVTVALNQNEFDALVSLVFNIGSGNFRGSTVRRQLNAGARRAAADAFLLWKVGGPGLIKRRHRERARFLTPAAPADPLAGLTTNERALVTQYDRLGGSRAAAAAARRRELAAALVAQRKRIWRAAKTSGWEKANRRVRYRVLAARTSM